MQRAGWVWICILMATVTACTNVMTEKTAENSTANPDSVAVSDFCKELLRRGQRNVNLEACQKGTLEKTAIDTSRNRTPSNTGDFYLFKGKAMQSGVPIECTAERLTTATWEILHCTNGSE